MRTLTGIRGKTLFRVATVVGCIALFARLAGCTGQPVPQTGGQQGPGTVISGTGTTGNGTTGTGTTGTGTTGTGTTGTGTTGTGTAGAGQTTAEVKIQGFAFSPSAITVKKGDKVQWTNEDSAPHTATSGSPGDATAGQLFDSGTLSTGQSFTHEFDTVGTFVYYCRIHGATMPSMRGATVTVTP